MQPGTPSDLAERNAELERELEIARDELRRSRRSEAEFRAYLEEAREAYDEVFNGAPVGYLTLDGQGLIEGVNVAGAGVLGMERQSLVGKPFLVFVARGSRKAFVGHLVDASEEGVPTSTELWLAPRKGRPRYVELVSRPIRQGPRKVIRTALVDQTERHHSTEALRERERELEARTVQLRRLAYRLTDAEHRERRKLAEVLHDQVQGALVATWMQADRLRHAGPDSLSARVDEVLRTLDEAVNRSRSLSHELAPRIVYDRGLAAGLRWLARNQVEQSGLRVHLEVGDRVDVNDERARALLFQSVRELLLNVTKHSGASEVWVRLGPADADTVEVQVEDRGVGFDPDQVLERVDGPTGLGLFDLHERLGWFDGTVTVDSRPGEGTTVTLRMPRGEEWTGRPATEGEGAEGEDGEEDPSSRRDTA